MTTEDAPAVPQGEHRRGTASRVERSALALFRAKGYAGSSIREIASGADIALATMFHHFPSKAAILEHLLHRIVDELRAELDEAVDPAAPAAEQVAAFVRVMVVAHCLRSDDSFVAQSELRSLPDEARRAIRDKRLAVQRIFYSIVESGCAQGEFTCTDPRTAATAIITMCTAVATWYRPGGTLTPDQLADAYVNFALCIINRR